MSLFIAKVLSNYIANNRFDAESILFQFSAKGYFSPPEAEKIVFFYITKLKSDILPNICKKEKFKNLKKRLTY